MVGVRSLVYLKDALSYRTQCAWQVVSTGMSWGPSCTVTPVEVHMGAVDSWRLGGVLHLQLPGF